MILSAPFSLHVTHLCLLILFARTLFARFYIYNFFALFFSDTLCIYWFFALALCMFYIYGFFCAIFFLCFLHMLFLGQGVSFSSISLFRLSDLCLDHICLCYVNVWPTLFWPSELPYLSLIPCVNKSLVFFCWSLHVNLPLLLNLYCTLVLILYRKTCL